jgi:predicted transcriptional regulator
MSTTSPQVVVPCTLSPSALAFLDQLSELRGYSRDTLIEQAVASFIDQQRRLFPHWQHNEIDSRTGHATVLPSRPE